MFAFRVAFCVHFRQNTDGSLRKAWRMDGEFEERNGKKGREDGEHFEEKRKLETTVSNCFSA